MRLSARNYDKMSIIHFLTSHEKNFAPYVETVDFRRIERQLRTESPQKSDRKDVANSRYHFRRREFDEAIKFAYLSISKK